MLLPHRSAKRKHGLRRFVEPTRRGCDGASPVAADRCAGLVPACAIGYITGIVAAVDLRERMTTMSDKQYSGGGGTDKASAGADERRRQRLAEELRANLARRKAQARSRRAGAADARPDGLPGADSTGADRDGAD